MPEGVEVAIAERDFTVATVATAAVLTAEEEAGVAPTAAEVPAIAQKEAEAAAPGAPGAAPGVAPAGGAKEGTKETKAAAPAPAPSKKETGDKKK
jgi:hypothetical protein